MRSISTILSAKTKQALQTLGNSGDPKMAVYSSRAKTTITDASYWTVETIRATTGLGDVSVAPRRFKSYGRPNRLYEIHVKDGEVSTSFREYPDKLKTGWQPQFTLGPSSSNGGSVAIAFDGYWERYRKLWRLITDEKPWIFWVDSTGILWRQHWDDISTLVQLDTNVQRVRAIRAWKNVNIADQDHGIVVGYIKTDGTVWYRNYCQQADYSYTWENARQLTEFSGVGVSLNLFIANDYRMGFIIEDSLGQIHWLITPRNWAGMAVAPEFIQSSVGGIIDFIPITREYGYITEYIQASVGGEIVLLYGSTYNSFLSVENTPITMLNESLEEYQDYGYRVRVEFEHEVFDLDIADLSLVDGNSIIYAISQATNIEGNVYELVTADMNNATGDLTLTFLGIGATTGEAGQTFLTFNKTFTPTGLVPTDIPIPEVEGIWNE